MKSARPDEVRSKVYRLFNRFCGLGVSSRMTQDGGLGEVRRWVERIRGDDAIGSCQSLVEHSALSKRDRVRIASLERIGAASRKLLHDREFGERLPNTQAQRPETAERGMCFDRARSQSNGPSCACLCGAESRFHVRGTRGHLAAEHPKDRGLGRMRVGVMRVERE